MAKGLAVAATLQLPDRDQWVLTRVRSHSKLTPMEPLGKHIRELRDKQDLSLREFARQLGCSAAFISDVELGRRYPSENVLEDIAGILKTTVEKLKAHDTRAPIEDIKKATAKNPRYALALRTVIDSKISPDELLEFMKNRDKSPAYKKPRR